MKGIELGKVTHLPVTDKFRSSLSPDRTGDPFMIAKAIKDSNSRRDRMPLRKVFGNDVPGSVSTVSPLNQKNYG